MPVFRALVALGCVAAAAAARAPLPAPPPLPYAHDALEPYISADIMRVHHEGHHAAYAARTSALLATIDASDSPELQRFRDVPLASLLLLLPQLPPSLGVALRDHGGGYVNHAAFWSFMCPASSPDALPHALDRASPLRTAVEHAFGGWKGFQTAFSQAAASVFGSGWAWLEAETSTECCTLVITTSANQESPFMKPNRVAILGLDVWEHAYCTLLRTRLHPLCAHHTVSPPRLYVVIHTLRLAAADLQYKNKRADYVNAWWNVVNATQMESLYNGACSCAPPSDAA
ncbi:superoxide dismutase, partial [archaeon]